MCGKGQHLLGHKERSWGQGRHFHRAKLSQDFLDKLPVGHSYMSHDAALLFQSRGCFLPSPHAAVIDPRRLIACDSGQAPAGTQQQP